MFNWSGSDQPKKSKEINLNQLLSTYQKLRQNAPDDRIILAGDFVKVKEEFTLLEEYLSMNMWLRHIDSYAYVISTDYKVRECPAELGFENDLKIVFVNKHGDLVFVSFDSRYFNKIFDPENLRVRPKLEFFINDKPLKEIIPGQYVRPRAGFSIRKEGLGKFSSAISQEFKSPLIVVGGSKDKVRLAGYLPETGKIEEITIDMYMLAPMS